MRHGTTNRRSRNRGSSGNNGGHRGNQQRTQVYDSNGPDVRIRGTAHQVAEKYIALAKDSTSAGDRVLAESYYQHAEHYIRIIGEMNGRFQMPGSKDSLSGDSFDETYVQEDSAVSIQKIDLHTMEPSDNLALPASILGAGVSRQAAESVE